MAFRGSRSTYIAGAGRFPGRFDREADHGRHPVRRFLDSTLDRIADWALLAGVIVFFILHADWWYDISQSSPDYISWVGVGAAMVSMMTSFVTSYARARAESVGFEVKNGIATRADRLVIILVGMAITGLTHHGLWLAIGMVLLAVLGVATVFQRILEARRQMTAGHRTYQP